jgi:hypothetical protein
MSSEANPPEAKEGSQPPVPRIFPPSYDDIALRAYFIALDRHRRGQPSDPFKDWVEAERQLVHRDDQR